MTTEKKILIQLADILAIGYECPNCHTRFSVPVDEFEYPLSKCQNCKQTLVNPAGLAPDDKALSEFVSALKELRRRKIGETLQLEIAGLPEAKS